MDDTITFYVEEAIKEKIRDVAKSQGLGLSGFCRFVILNQINRVEEQE